LNGYLPFHQTFPKGGIRERLCTKRAVGSGFAPVPCGDQEKDDQEEIRAQEKGAGEEKDREESPGEKERATQSSSRSALDTTTARA
jgi:hypothetical protein